MVASDVEKGERWPKTSDHVWLRWEHAGGRSQHKGRKDDKYNAEISSSSL